MDLLLTLAIFYKLVLYISLRICGKIFKKILILNIKDNIVII